MKNNKLLQNGIRKLVKNSFKEGRLVESKVINSIKYESRYKNDPVAAQKIANMSPDLDVNLTDISKAIGVTRAAVQETQDRTDIPDQEKRQLMDTYLFQMGSMAKMGNQRMKDFKENNANIDQKH